MSLNLREPQPYKNPEFYQHKADRLRLQNQLLRKQLEGNFQAPNTRKTFETEKIYQTQRNPVNYSFHQDIPVRQVIYNPVTGPIRPPTNIQRPSSFENYPQRAKAETYPVLPDRDVQYVSNDVGSYNDLERKYFMNEVQEEIIQLQARGYKLQRQANRLSSYIKEDIRDFIRDSHVHKECSYKQKYLRAISNRPRYFRFNL